MSGKTISTSATRAEALTLQSSTYGATVAWLRGVNKLPGNLVWYGDFRAIPHTTTQGGKGGGGSRSTTYTYAASLVMGLCHGTITAIPKVWKGKGQSTPTALGLSLLNGAVGQAVWSGLAGKGIEAIGYSGLACVAGQDYSLGDSASVDNHSFEVVHSSAYALGVGVPDVDPSVAMADLMTDASEGAGLDPALLGDWSDWSDWCVASGLLVSPAITEQIAAIEALRTAAELTNTGIVWSDGKLKMVPYADQAAVGHGRTFTPSNTPLYQLDDTCYTPARGKEPVRMSSKTPTDLHNHVRVQYKDRSNGYQIAIAEATDLTDISINGRRSKPVIQAHWICDAGVARLVAELLKQRSLLVPNTYVIDLPINYALTEPMDLLTLTDSVLRMADIPVRVTQVQEEGDDTLTITCEDFPAGSANAPIYAAQVPVGYAGNYLAAPGSTAQVVVFEAPGALVGGTLEVWVAARGDGAFWGGCTVWVSLDGTSYKAMGRIEGGSRCGTLTGPIATGAMPVQIGAKQQLVSASSADAAALNSLCYVDGTPEFFAYESATLTGAGAYSLGGLVQGAYHTTPAAHASGAKFAFVDASVARSDVIDPSYIGKTIHIKCTSFNVYGVAEQSLADVAAVDYVITGAQFVSNKSLRLLPSSTYFKIDKLLAVTPTTITLSAVGAGLAGAPSFSVTTGSAVLSGTGTSRTLTEAGMTTDLVTVQCTWDGVIDVVTITKMRDGTDGAGSGSASFSWVLAGDAVAPTGTSIRNAGPGVGVGNGGHSVENYIGGAQMTFRTTTAAYDSTAAGLGTSPTAYPRFTWIMFADHTCSANNGGSHVGGSTWAAGDTFSVLYDGGDAKWYKNGSLLFTVTGVGAGLQLYLAVALVYPGAELAGFGFAGGASGAVIMTYRQELDPGAVANGSTWTVPSTGRSYLRQGGVWIPTVGPGSVTTDEIQAQAVSTNGGMLNSSTTSGGSGTGDLVSVGFFVGPSLTVADGDLLDWSVIGRHNQFVLSQSTTDRLVDNFLVEVWMEIKRGAEAAIEVGERMRIVTTARGPNQVTPIPIPFQTQIVPGAGTWALTCRYKVNAMNDQGVGVYRNNGYEASARWDFKRLKR
nr:phage tail protein [uncultured Roseateles sp.]